MNLASRKPALRLQAFPTAAEYLAAAGEQNQLVSVFDLAEVVGLSVNRVVRPTGKRIKSIVSRIDSQASRRLLIGDCQSVVPLAEFLVR